MHELTLLAGLFRQIERAAREHGARRVVAVRLRLGALAHLSAEHLREHFSRMAGGSVAHSARLEITVGTDVTAADAQDIVLESIEVEP